jgi:hypothetical protein
MLHEGSVNAKVFLDFLKRLMIGLSRLLGLETAQASCNGTAAFESSRALGDIWALTRLWESLGLHRLGDAFRQVSRHRIDLEALLRVTRVRHIFR